jgi:hypothetical protein
MQIARFKAGGKTRYGTLEGAVVVEYSGTPFTLFRRGRRRYPLKHTVLLAPVVPSKIVAVGLKELVARVSEVMTLLPGDVIATGTPSGVGPLVPGDRVELRIEGIGSLWNTVVKW